jgi:sugar transferase (PEP-CTERM/EpsH1 system associated)
VEPLRDYCTEILPLELRPAWRKIASLGGFLTGKPLTIPYYAERRLHDWVAEMIARHDIRKVLVFSSSMAQYVDAREHEILTRVVDFVDIDSEKWRSYAALKSWPMSRIYAREADKLLDYEIEIANRFDHSLFVSQAEADLFKRLSNVDGAKVAALQNGVDLEYFDPGSDLDNPYPESGSILVFTGAMDYWANVDAVSWFAYEVFPAVRTRVPTAEFWIVGSRPTEAVRNLRHLAGVTVTGAVNDVRPYLRYASAAVAPMRVARGIQNKVLEAMAMGKPVIVTPQAIEGINIGAGYESLISKNISEMVDTGAAVLNSDQYSALGAAGRAYVERHHDWPSQLQLINALFNGGNATS